MGSDTRKACSLEGLIRFAIGLLKDAEQNCPRTGPGAKPVISDWFMGLLIYTAVLKSKKSKSSMWRFVSTTENKKKFFQLTGEKSFPSRSTFFRRYKRAHALFQVAIVLQGKRAIDEGIVEPKHLAIDKSVLKARGKPYHKSDRMAGKRPKNVDFDAGWGYSKLHGWTYGYSFEVVVSSTPGSVVFPLVATANTGNAAETTTAHTTIPLLPTGARTLSADAGYDSNKLAEQIEFGADGKPTGRKFLCPENPRNKRTVKKGSHQTDQQIRSRKLRMQRSLRFKKPESKRIYKRRTKTVEPFNSWFKSLFALDRAWHRGLANNQTQILAAIFCYQALVRYNFRLNKTNARIKPILDAL